MLSYLISDVNLLKTACQRQSAACDGVLPSHNRGRCVVTHFEWRLNQANRRRSWASIPISRLMVQDGGCPARGSRICISVMTVSAVTRTMEAVA